jgi:hypothetical protein
MPAGEKFRFGRKGKIFMMMIPPDETEGEKLA